MQLSILDYEKCDCVEIEDGEQERFNFFLIVR